MSRLIPGVVRHAFDFEPTVLTPYTFATVLIPAFLGYYGMAVLVQLPRTRLCRAALLPVVVWLAVRACMSLDASWGYPGLAYLNQGVALAMFTVAMRSTTWVFTQKPYARYPLHKPSKPKTMNGHHHNGNGNGTSTDTTPLRTAIWNAWDLTVNLRGIGWNWPRHTHIPKPSLHITSRPLFFLHTLLRLIFFATVFDAISGIIRSFGPDTFGTPNGGTIFDPNLPPLKRYLRSSLITLLSGTSAYLIIETVYHLHATLFLLLFHQHPTQWPPLFDAPWLSTSLADFWGRRWHQLFREYFVAVGGKALVRYLGRPGIVLGAFTISGILHDVGMRGMGRGGDSLPVIGFFVLHGIGVLFEGAFRWVTGRRVSGMAGSVWTVLWMLVWGNAVVDVWARRGLIGSVFWVERYRPVRVVMGWVGYEM